MGRTSTRESTTSLYSYIKVRRTTDDNLVKSGCPTDGAFTAGNRNDTLETAEKHDTMKTAHVAFLILGKDRKDTSNTRKDIGRDALAALGTH